MLFVDVFSLGMPVLECKVVLSVLVVIYPFLVLAYDVLCCCFTLGSEGCCFTSSAYGSGKALFLCRLCVRHGYFNFNPTDDKKKKNPNHILYTFFMAVGEEKSGVVVILEGSK